VWPSIGFGAIDLRAAILISAGMCFSPHEPHFSASHVHAYGRKEGVD
jgi:hypothetical protein